MKLVFAFLLAGVCSCARPDATFEVTPEVTPVPADTVVLPIPAVAPGIPAPPPEDVGVAVEYLLGSMASSPLVFIRNGSKHTGAEAAAHIRSKYKHYKKDISTAEEFIAKAATRSEISGKLYMVQLADGTEASLSEWLKAKLAEWRLPEHH